MPKATPRGGLLASGANPHRANSVIPLRWLQQNHKANIALFTSKISRAASISIATTWLDIPVNALAVQWLPRSEQLHAGSIRSAALFIGAIVGGGVMVLALSRWGWQAPFVLMGAALLLGCLPFAARRAQASLPVQSEAGEQPSAPSGVRADWASFFAQPGAKQWTWMLLTL